MKFPRTIIGLLMQWLVLGSILFGLIAETPRASDLPLFLAFWLVLPVLTEVGEILEIFFGPAWKFLSSEPPPRDWARIRASYAESAQRQRRGSP